MWQAAIKAFHDDMAAADGAGHVRFSSRAAMSAPSFVDWRPGSQVGDNSPTDAGVIHSEWPRLKQVLSSGASLPAAAVPYVLLAFKEDPKGAYQGVQGLKEFNSMLRKARIEGLFDLACNDQSVIPGMSVSHEMRGAGIVVEIDSDYRPCKPYKVYV